MMSKSWMLCPDSCAKTRIHLVECNATVGKPAFDKGQKLSVAAQRWELDTRVHSSRFLLARASDDRLLREMRQGSEAAIEVAYDRHSPGLLAMCRHILGSREEAEEALQHTFVTAWSSVRRPDRAGPKLLKPWLYAVARNRCLAMIQKRH